MKIKNTPRRVLLVTTNFPRWKSDFRAPFILEVANGLVKNGYQVRVLTMHNPGSLELEKFDSITVHRVRYAKDQNEILQKDSAGIPAAWKRDIFSKMLLFIFFVKLMLAIIKYAKDADVIHANWTLSGMAVCFTGFFHHLPYVVTIHGSDVYGVSSMSILRFVTRIALNHADKVIAVSQDLKNEAIKMGVKGENISVIPTGVNTQTFSFNASTERKSRILFVGSLIKRKGVNTLLKAFARIHPVFPDYELWIIGEGEEKDSLLVQAKEVNISSSTHFMGTKNQSEISKLMQTSKIFVLPSLEEGQGAVLVEAMASGTPCIGSKVGGIPGVIDPSTGLLFEPGDSNELSQKIKVMLSDQELWKQFSVKGRQKVEERFSWDHLSKRIIETYPLSSNRWGSQND